MNKTFQSEVFILAVCSTQHKRYMRLCLSNEISVEKRTKLINEGVEKRNQALHLSRLSASHTGKREKLIVACSSDNMVGVVTLLLHLEIRRLSDL